MAQSINTKVDFVDKATSYHGINTYGEIMIGDKGFEFYNDNNVEDYIQIPWEEVDYIAASVIGKKKHKIPRFAVMTKKNGNFSFSAQNPKPLLRAASQYIPAKRIVRSLSFFEVLSRNISSWFRKTL